jgi:hypothetical protein
MLAHTHTYTHTPVIGVVRGGPPRALRPPLVLVMVVVMVMVMELVVMLLLVSLLV